VLGAWHQGTVFKLTVAGVEAEIAAFEVGVGTAEGSEILEAGSLTRRFFNVLDKNRKRLREHVIPCNETPFLGGF
jgi:hypothetical protein